MQRENPLYEQQFFQNVASGTIEKLWKAGSVKKFPKGHILMRARDRMNQVYIQLSGKSMVYNLTHSGKRKIIFIFGGGSLLNEHILHVQSASLFCETIEKSDIFVVSLSLFLKCMEEDFTLAGAVLEAHENRIWRMGHQLKNTLGSVYMEQKLAAKLWKLARDFGMETPDGIEIDINLPVTLLADMLGASRETTSRLCSTLVGLGLIKLHKKRIIVTDPHKMAIYYKFGRVE